jgi:hypothetical protein
MVPKLFYLLVSLLGNVCLINNIYSCFVTFNSIIPLESLTRICEYGDGM